MEPVEIKGDNSSPKLGNFDIHTLEYLYTKPDGIDKGRYADNVFENLLKSGLVKIETEIIETKKGTETITTEKKKIKITEDGVALLLFGSHMLASTYDTKDGSKKYDHPIRIVASWE